MTTHDELKEWADESADAWLDLLRARVNDRRDHLNRMTNMYYGSAAAAGEFLDGASNRVEPAHELATVDATGNQASREAVEGRDLANDHVLRSTHLNLLRLELTEARLDLIETTLNISHSQTLVDLGRMLDSSKAVA